MPLYTFIMEFKGGTYISQVEASSPSAACVNWAESLDVSKIFGLGLKGKDDLIKYAKEEAPVALRDTLNTWCLRHTIRGRSALINLVQTEAENKKLSFQKNSSL